MSRAFGAGSGPRAWTASKSTSPPKMAGPTFGVLSPRVDEASSGYRHHDVAQLSAASLLATLRQFAFPLAKPAKAPRSPAQVPWQERGRHGLPGP